MKVPAQLTRLWVTGVVVAACGQDASTHASPTMPETLPFDDTLLREDLGGGPSDVTDVGPGESDSSVDSVHGPDANSLVDVIDDVGEHEVSQDLMTDVVESDTHAEDATTLDDTADVANTDALDASLPPPCGLVDGDIRIPTFRLAPPGIWATEIFEIEATGSGPSEFFAGGTVWAPSESGVPVVSVQLDMPALADSVTRADLDGDGRDDIVFVHDGGVSILTQTSWGHFERTDVLAGEFLASTAGDVNDDGVPELVVHSLDGRLIVLTRSPVGEYGQLVSRTLSQKERKQALTSSLIVWDVDADGRGDIVHGYVFRSTEDLTFPSLNPFNLVAEDVCLLLPLDYDLDGEEELVCSGDLPTMKALWKGPPGTAAIEVPAFYPGRRVRLARDLDGDGIADIGVFGIENSGIALLKRFDDGSVTVMGDWPSRGGGLTAVDVDLDGDLDLYAVPYFGIPDLIVNEGAGAFRRMLQTILPWTVRQWTTGDYDGDGFDDVAISDGWRLAWLRSRGDGSFMEVVLESGYSVRRDREQFVVSALRSADVDGDGRDEIVVSDRRDVWCEAPEAARILRVNSQGELETVQIAGLSGQSLDVADVDMDGWPDLVQAVPLQGPPPVECAPILYDAPWAPLDADPFPCLSPGGWCFQECLDPLFACSTVTAEIRWSRGGPGGHGPWASLPMSLVSGGDGTTCWPENRLATDVRIIDENGDGLLDLHVSTSSFSLTDFAEPTCPEWDPYCSLGEYFWLSAGIDVQNQWDILFGGSGNGQFAAAHGRSASDLERGSFGDFDGDGDWDAAASVITWSDPMSPGGGVNGKVILSMNLGASTPEPIAMPTSGATDCQFSKQPIVHRFETLSCCVQSSFESLPSIGDFNGDRCDDMVYVAKYDPAALAAPAGTIRFILGHSTETVRDVSVPQPARRYVGNAAGGDFNGDGKTDVLVMDDQLGYVFLNTTEWPSLTVDPE